MNIDWMTWLIFYQEVPYLVFTSFKIKFCSTIEHLYTLKQCLLMIDDKWLHFFFKLCSNLVYWILEKTSGCDSMGMGFDQFWGGRTNPTWIWNQWSSSSHVFTIPEIMKKFHNIFFILFFYKVEVFYWDQSEIKKSW